MKAIRKIINSRLGVIVFLSGATVMSVELLGTRLIAPYLGGSIYVWTSVIGVILGALSLGYYLGGHLADRRPNWRTFALVLLASGIAILIMSVTKDLILALSALLGVRWGSVLAAVLLFAAPSILLGLVTPFAVRLNISNLQTSGHTVGNLYALSTLGSIVGTFATGFFLIPNFSTTHTLFALAAVQVILSLLASGKKRIASPVITLFIIFVASVTAGGLINISGLLVNEDSAYAHIRVYDGLNQENNRPVRQLFLDINSSSAEYLDNPEENVFTYVDMYRLDSLFNPDIKNGLLIGGGAYSTATDFLRRWPGSKMDVVEIDPRVTEVAFDYFSVKPSERLKTFNEDARVFINQTKTKYDAVYGDVFRNVHAPPFQLTTKQSFQQLFDLLNDEGVFLFNVISAVEGKNANFLQAELKTLQAVFPQVYVFITREDLNSIQNVIVVASKSQQHLDSSELAAHSNELNKKYLGSLLSNWPDLSAAMELDDNFAPVEYLVKETTP